MGTKRVGLARTQALIENLKRDLAMGGSTFNGATREVLRQTVVSVLAAKTLTVAESGALILLDKDEAVTFTLPPITSNDVGVNYTFVETVVSNLSRRIATYYDNDYLVGGVSNLFDAAGDTDVLVTFVSAGATDTIITLGDDNLANAGGGLGANVTLTAVLTGNVANGGGAKLVWAVTGTKIAQAATDTGAAFFT
ncbi:hypothetical protein CL634_10840 [bacterium]|nr:hypothetical protein [bacterium]